MQSHYSTALPFVYTLTLQAIYVRFLLLVCRLRPDNGEKTFAEGGDIIMERIKTLETRNLCESAKNGGCGECQTSCQSACKTSCGVANQKCENSNK